MGEYRIQEAYLELPEGWMDVSVNSLDYARPEGKLRLVVTRIPREKETLESAIDKRLVEQRRKLPFFEVSERHAKLVATLPCVDLTLTYRDGDDNMMQRTATFLIGPRIVVIAAVGKVEQKPEITALLDRALNSLEVRKVSE